MPNWKKRQSSGEMMSINHGAFAGLCIKTQTEEQAKNFKHNSRKHRLSEDLADKTKQTNTKNHAETQCVFHERHWEKKQLQLVAKVWNYHSKTFWEFKLNLMRILESRFNLKLGCHCIVFNVMSPICIKTNAFSRFKMTYKFCFLGKNTIKKPQYVFQMETKRLPSSQNSQMIDRHFNIKRNTKQKLLYQLLIFFCCCKKCVDQNQNHNTHVHNLDSGTTESLENASDSNWGFE